MTKLELIAKAIYERRNGHGCKAWAHLPRSHQEPYLGDARAAVEAMQGSVASVRFEFTGKPTFENGFIVFRPDPQKKTAT